MKNREGYWDYMGRKLREDRSKMSPIQIDMAGLTEAHYKVLSHLKEVTEHNFELIKKLERLGGDPKQMEFNF